MLAHFCHSVTFPEVARDCFFGIRELASAAAVGDERKGSMHSGETEAAAAEVPSDCPLSVTTAILTRKASSTAVESDYTGCFLRA